jgi:Flp pilus assembly pilin Flp
MSNFATLLRRLAQDESGAVTVDWVALTAAVVVAGLLIGFTVMEGAFDVATAIATDLATITPPFGQTP